MQIYKKNFLTNVIARIDYQSIDDITKSLNTDLEKKALEFFPFAEPKKDLIGVQFQLSVKEVKREEIGKKVEWRFSGRNREKSLCISNEYMFIAYSIFDNYEIFCKEFNEIIQILFNVYKDIQVKRTGLRYINNITIPEQNYTEWNDYLNDNLLSIFNIAPDKKEISRAFHLLELNYGDMNLKIQYGMFNPDYPAPLRQKTFTLDYDAFFEGLQSEADIKQNISKFNSNIETIFESCIKNKLREVMNSDG